MNVFPSFESYIQTFKDFIENHELNAKIFFDKSDQHLVELSKDSNTMMIPYEEHPYTQDPGGKCKLNVHSGGLVEINLFGAHNMRNLNAAKLICRELGIEDNAFYKAIASFQGADRRLQLLHEGETQIVYQDFAHAPSKVRATCKAVREKYPHKRILACLELHTFSSLNKNFLPLYAGSLSSLDQALILFDPHTLKMKNMPALNPREIMTFFGEPHPIVLDDPADLKLKLEKFIPEFDVFLFMSSGRFGGLDIKGLFL